MNERSSRSTGDPLGLQPIGSSGSKHAAGGNFEDQYDMQIDEKQVKVEEEGFDEKALKDIESFIELDENGLTEEEEAERLAAERRRRREEILKKHQEALGSNTHQSPPSAAAGPASLHPADSGVDLAAAVAQADKEAASQGPAIIEATDDDKNMANEADALAAELEAVEAEVKRTEPTAFDMFSSSPSDIAGIKPSKGGLLKTAFINNDDAGAHLQSNWDDHEGYYKATVGEIMNDRYRTLGVIGRGVFSTVLKCVDLQDESNVVAIKMIRNNDIMRKAAEKELFLLSLISQRDPENKKHCVKLLANFEYRHHTAFVFESMQMNLRETLKKFGKNVGINVSAVRMYGRQLFVALRHLAELQICHADIKPDNILVSNDLKQVKLCDFGSAFRETDPDRDPTPYLQSRFYRCPEVILGLQYDHLLDLWSVGVCLYEIFTGHVMFPGQSNNEMLRLMQAVKGRFPNKMLRSHLRACETLRMEEHFDSDLKFKQQDRDPITGMKRALLFAVLS
jgi:serine/threonine-protein kinase PRP4